MFTGIVRQLGCVCNIEDCSYGKRLIIEVTDELSRDLAAGASVALNGVCLTVVGISPGLLTVDLIPESLIKTNLGDLKVGGFVHLERSLRWGDEVGGHLLSGHVLGTGTIVKIAANSRFIRVSEKTRCYLFEKGFVAVDGISLTVVDVDDDVFRIDLIPETLRVTLLGYKKEEDKVNIEVDFMTQSVVDTSKRFLKENFGLLSSR